MSRSCPFSGSHKLHHLLPDMPSAEDWHVLTVRELLLLSNGGAGHSADSQAGFADAQQRPMRAADLHASLGMVHVETEPGDLLLWDSRVAHCGRRARDALPHTAWRFAFFICMIEAGRLSEADRQRKREQLGIGAPAAAAPPATTSHWPDGRLVKSRKGDKAPGVVSAPAWVLESQDALRLAGAEAYDA